MDLFLKGVPAWDHSADNLDIRLWKDYLTAVTLKNLVTPNIIQILKKSLAVRDLADNKYNFVLSDIDEVSTCWLILVFLSSQTITIVSHSLETSVHWFMLDKLFKMSFTITEKLWLYKPQKYGLEASFPYIAQPIDVAAPSPL